MFKEEAYLEEKQKNWLIFRRRVAVWLMLRRRVINWLMLRNRVTDWPVQLAQIPVMLQQKGKEEMRERVKKK